MGHNVTVVTSSYSHLFKYLPKKRKETIDGVDYLWLKMFNYGTSHDKRRVLKWFYFMLKLFFLPLRLKKPDVIIVSPMAPFPIVPAWLFSKIYKVKLIYEVKDIWPLSLVELGGFSPNHPLIKFMGWFERFAIKKSDVIVSNLQNYGEYIKNNVKSVRSFEWISNGVDMEELSQIVPLSDEIKHKIPKDKFIVGYVGTVGVANALDSFCEAAHILKNYKDILFIIVGDGQEKQNLVDVYGKFDNILFIHSIPKKQVQSILTLFDLCYIGLKKEKLFRYGVSPNKLYDYMYSAKPVLYAIDSGKNNIVDTVKCGISVEAGNKKAIADGIMALYRMDKKRRADLGKSAKEYVLKHFTYKNLALKYEKLL